VSLSVVAAPDFFSIAGKQYVNVVAQRGIVPLVGAHVNDDAHTTGWKWPALDVGIIPNCASVCYYITDLHNTPLLLDFEICE